jgi:UDPglucose--hexose-1-phosphate uridylyltransferase
MYSQELLKSAGRPMILSVYSRYRTVQGIQAPPSPGNELIQGNPHLRWHPLRGEWVAYASVQLDQLEVQRGNFYEHNR